MDFDYSHLLTLKPNELQLKLLTPVELYITYIYSYPSPFPSISLVNLTKSVYTKKKNYNKIVPDILFSHRIYMVM